MHNWHASVSVWEPNGIKIEQKLSLKIAIHPCIQPVIADFFLCFWWSSIYDRVREYVATSNRDWKPSVFVTLSLPRICYCMFEFMSTIHSSTHKSLQEKCKEWIFFKAQHGGGVWGYGMECNVRYSAIICSLSGGCLKSTNISDMHFSHRGIWRVPLVWGALSR